MKKIVLFTFTFLMMFSSITFAQELETMYFPMGVPTEFYTPVQKKPKLFAKSTPTLYELVETAMLNHKENIQITQFNLHLEDIEVKDGDKTKKEKVLPKEITNAVYNVVYNYPERGDLTGSLNAYYDPNNDLINKIEFLYAENYNQAEYEQAVDMAASECINNDMTDMQKIMSIHDYLAEKCVYYPEFETDKTHNACFSGWGAFVEHEPVCQGYSIAFKLMCDRAGIRCGYASSPEINHIWNLVELNGKFYHIDVTWDDKDSFGAIFQIPKTENVNLNDPNIDHYEDKGNYYNIYVKFTKKYYITHNFFLLSDTANNLAKKIAYPEKIVYNVTPTEDTAFDNDSLKSFIGKAVWEDGKMYLDRNQLYRTGLLDADYLPDKYYTYDGERIVEITKDEYLPKETDYKIYNPLNSNQSYCDSDFVSIHGVPQTDAILYMADYDDTGRMCDISKDMVEFDENGEALYKITNPFSKLILMSGEGKCVPLAKCQTKSMNDM